LVTAPRHDIQTISETSGGAFRCGDETADFNSARLPDPSVARLLWRLFWRLSADNAKNTQAEAKAFVLTQGITVSGI